MIERFIVSGKNREIHSSPQSSPQPFDRVLTDNTSKHSEDSHMKSTVLVVHALQI
jgi:hypothetical protein